MKSPLTLEVEAELQDLARKRDDHRRLHGPKRRLPQELWDRAIALYGQTTRVRIAHALGVSVNGLLSRKKSQRVGSKKSTNLAPCFLEVKGVRTSPSLQFLQPPNSAVENNAQGIRQIEIQRLDGSRLRIVDIGVHGLNIRTLIQDFLSPGHGVFQ